MASWYPEFYGESCPVVRRGFGSAGCTSNLLRYGKEPRVTWTSPMHLIAAILLSLANSRPYWRASLFHVTVSEVPLLQGVLSLRNHSHQVLIPLQHGSTNTPLLSLSSWKLKPRLSTAKIKHLVPFARLPGFDSLSHLFQTVPPFLVFKVYPKTFGRTESGKYVNPSTSTNVKNAWTYTSTPHTSSWRTA